MNTNETRNFYEWIGRGVVKTLFELGIIGMMLIASLIMAIVLLKVTNIFDAPPKNIIYSVAAMAIPTALFVLGILQGIHKKTASHILKNLTLETKEKIYIAIFATIGGLAAGIAEYLSTGEYSITKSFSIAIFAFLILFFVSYGIIYFIRKREEKKEQELSHGLSLKEIKREEEMVKRQFEEIKDIIPKMKSEVKSGDEIYYIKASSGHFRLWANGHGKIYLTGNIEGPAMIRLAKKLAIKIKRNLGVSIVVDAYLTKEEKDKKI